MAWAGANPSPCGDLHFPFWAAKPCDGQNGRIRLNLMPCTVAAQVEFTGLHAAAIALIGESEPPCSRFDLSRWGLTEAANAVAARAAGVPIHEAQESSAARSSSDAARRSRSRSPRKGKGKARTPHGRSGLEPAVIELLKAYYAKNWRKLAIVADQIWHSRENIQKQIQW